MIPWQDILPKKIDLAITGFDQPTMSFWAGYNRAIDECNATLQQAEKEGKICQPTYYTGGKMANSCSFGKAADTIIGKSGKGMELLKKENEKNCIPRAANLTARQKGMQNMSSGECRG